VGMQESALERLFGRFLLLNSTEVQKINSFLEEMVQNSCLLVLSRGFYVA
jgi:hypothetical protein